MCLRKILIFLTAKKLIKLQLVNKRRFHMLAQALISHMCIFRRTGIHMHPGTKRRWVPQLNILMSTENSCSWKTLKLKRKDSGK